MARKLERQEVLYVRRKKFTFPVTEQAARSPFVSPDAVAVQLDRLASLTQLPNVHLGVLPIEPRLPGCPLNTFTVYDERLATVETTAGVMVFRDPGDVRMYLDEFAGYAEHAVFGEQCGQPAAVSAPRRSKRVLSIRPGPAVKPEHLHAWLAEPPGDVRPHSFVRPLRRSRRP
ncbi:Scr1 family TA system antitoxin-like transcriptional regulator [Streptomyces sp. NPDC016309]|uniref:Scr1 family TA system antitoxin-like transcriptional regulator n=1 Tax=Streptomyces sp. NPDC016309 TaxID=3364965 RepID=UPI0036F5DAA0